MPKTFIKHVYQLQSEAFIKECGLENIRVWQADQNQMFRKLLNCLEGVHNDLSFCFCKTSSKLISGGFFCNLYWFLSE